MVSTEFRLYQEREKHTMFWIDTSSILYNVAAEHSYQTVFFRITHFTTPPFSFASRNILHAYTLCQSVYEKTHNLQDCGF